MSVSTSASTSFLMRFWWERRDADRARPVLRGVLRNLRTGEEQLVGSLMQLDRYMQRQLGLDEATLEGRPGES